MTCEVKIIEDSVNKDGKRLTTVQLKYWRAIHAEAKTHRVFSQVGEEYELVLTQDESLMSDRGLSRNASSSRAIPVSKMIEQVRTDPAGPIHWGSNKPGMQAGEELTGEALADAKRLWNLAANNAADVAEQMMELGLHKQVVNRILEAWQYIHVLVTASEWENFFELRCHPDAQPEIQELATAIRDAMADSTPRLLEEGEWHLPYVSDYERQDGYWKGKEIELCKMSAARCARVSYLMHDGGIPSIAKDLELFDRLVGSAPIHASPIEHQATPDRFDSIDDEWKRLELHGNFVGWKQYRKIFEQMHSGQITNL